MVTKITSPEAFKELISTSTGLVVIDFFTTWCGPCKAIAPFVEKLAKRYTSATFVKVDCDEQEALCDKLNISSFPTFHLYLHGKRVGQVKGADRDALEEKVNKLCTAIAAAAAAPAKTKKRAAGDGDGDGAVEAAPTATNPKKKKPKPSPAAEKAETAETTETVDTEAMAILVPAPATGSAPKAVKPWKIKPSNNEGVLVPKPRAMKKGSGVTVTDVIIGHGIEPKPGSKVRTMAAVGANCSAAAVSSVSCTVYSSHHHSHTLHAAHHAPGDGHLRGALPRRHRLRRPLEDQAAVCVPQRWGSPRVSACLSIPRMKTGLGDV